MPTKQKPMLKEFYFSWKNQVLESQEMAADSYPIVYQYMITDCFSMGSLHLH